MEAQEEQRSFAHLLLRYRLRAEMTQQELADFSTISVRAIRDLEHGRALHPRRDTVRLLADGLRIGDRDRSRLEEAAGRGTGRSLLRAGLSGAAAAPTPAGEPLLGRENELSSLVASLSTDGPTALSLVGAPGVGKSRLAFEAAALLHRDHGLPVLWASSSHDLVPHGPDGVAGLPDGIVDVLHGAAENRGDLSALEDTVGDRAALLLLDDPRPDPLSPRTVARLLSRCSGLRVLTTSPRPHGLTGEQVFLLDPPDLGAAVRILEARLRRSDPLVPSDGGQGLSAEICGLVDHLPGALAAVATWSTVYDASTLVSCLRKDPVPLLAPLSGDGADTGVGLARSLAELPPAQDGLLGLLCASPAGETALRIAETSGLSPADCGRALADLITRGLVLRDRATGDSRFHTLNLVRALRGPAAVPAEPMEYVS
ncbi:helix-turn-helix transcriptional regulator [Nocardiopsis sp. CNT312]|uniref:helix-turn-helix domain-containing protein n=1 Tax=Nocardiopsis sp. CNT312 TaxID=1137268 RepID=UPI0004B33E0C|nr:helix-turn-helix transcriptional regulator [Nocardiopsis sp. CNT312]